MYFATCPVHDHSRSSTPPPEPFRFLDLPPEIRERIASYALTASSTITVRLPQYNRHPPPAPEPMFLTSPRLDYPLPRTPPLTPPTEHSLNPAKLAQLERELSSRKRDGHSRLALLMACRRTYLDHWATYYRNNAFAFSPTTWSTFRPKIPQWCLQELRHIHFRMPYRSQQMFVWRTLAELRNLETITVVLAPSVLASRLERVSCVAGARLCENLKSLKIERCELADSVTSFSEEDNKRELKEDQLVENSINKKLEERQNSKHGITKLSNNGIRKAMSREGSRARRDKRLRLMDSPTPDERAMDEYFHIVESAAEEEVDAEGQAA